MAHVPWSINVPPAVTTEYAGTRLGDCFADWRTMLSTQLAAQRRFAELYGLDCIPLLSDPPCYLGVAALGGDVIFPEDEQPMIGNRGQVLSSATTVERLTAPAPQECPLVAAYVGFYRAMRGRVPPETPVYLGHGQAGPVSTAVLLRGEDFLLDLYRAPSLAHWLLQCVTDVSIAFRRMVAAITAIECESVGVADDFAGLVAPAMWPEYVVPYWRQIFETSLGKPRIVHSELLQRGHLRFLTDLEIAVFDPGMDQYLTVRMICETVDTPFTWNLFTSRDMLLGTPERVQALYRQAVSDGAPMMTTELCRRTPHANVRAFLEVARALEVSGKD